MAALEAVSTWFGCFVLEGSRVRERYASPTSIQEIAERIATRRNGQLTPEETRLIQEHRGVELVTGDRRLAAHGLQWDSRAQTSVDPGECRAESSVLREAMLLEAERALKASWDPSIHVTEAVRAMSDLDRAQNLIGERLGSWAARDAPDLDPGDARRAAARLLDEPSAIAPLERPEAKLGEARRSLAQAYRSLGATRDELARALEASGTDRTPNLAHLLGPDLAARLVAQAGGLERLSRLPAGTVQVLGAERAFFEHLRGRAPPPRHGLLFLYPQIQSATRSARGRLARALAGKVAIAAKLDQARAPLDPRLREQFEARARAIAAHPSRPGGRRRSRLPLDRAASDR